MVPFGIGNDLSGMDGHNGTNKNEENSLVQKIESFPAEVV
jgi:hypothetical protein